MTPRDYQAKAIDNLFEQHAAGSKATLSVSPTGSGKTVLASLAADRWLQEPNRKVLVIAHERQLVWQFHQEVSDILGIEVGIEMGTERTEHTKMPDIVVACRASLQPKKTLDEEGNVVPGSSRLWKYPAHNTEYLVIIDEAHRWKWGLKSCAHIFKHFEQNPRSIRLGLTATPMRGDEVSLRDAFPDVCLDYRLYDLGQGPNAVDDGWAVPYDQRFITGVNVDFTNIKEVGGDFDARELELALAERKQLLSLVRPTLDLVGERQTLIFSPTVAMAKAVAACICGELNDWSAAKSLDGSVPDAERQQAYQDHQSGNYQYLSCCGLAREGYNDPNLGAIGIFRPTKSIGLAEQMKGRGCRPLRGLVDGLATREERLAAIKASGKPNCMIVDLVGITGLGKAATTANILLGGRNDQVAERAMMLAMAADGECDMVETIQKAEEEIEKEKAEKEERRLEAVARWEAEQRADKARKLEARVEYNAKRVEQGHGERNDLEPASPRARMLFGKYRGVSLCDPKIPDDYLQWAEKNLDKMPAWWMGALHKEMRYRAMLPPKPPKPTRQEQLWQREDRDNLDHINRILMER